jgi:hypothetical protein
LIAEQPWFRQEEIGRPEYAWRPDGKHIVYSALSGSGQTGLVLVDLESGARTRLTAPPRAHLPNFRFRNTTTGSVEVLTLKDKSIHSYPVAIDNVPALAIAPGGQRYSAGRTTASGTTTVRTAPGARRSGAYPREEAAQSRRRPMEGSIRRKRVDGEYLYFSRSREAPALLRRKPDGAEELLIAELVGRMWVAGKEGVYFLNSAANHFMYFDLATRKTAKVFPIGKPSSHTQRGLDRPPDGRELLWRQTDFSSSDIALVENYRP